MNAEHAVFARRAQRDRLAAKRLAETNAAVLELDVPFLVGLAHRVGSSVFDGRQSLRERTRAWPVPHARRRQIECLMRALVIVHMPPAVEGPLALGQIPEVTPAQHLGLERAMEALVLALRLRMIRPPMLHPHA